MGQILHGSATTTEAVRRAIQNSQASLRQHAGRYCINPIAGTATETSLTISHKMGNYLLELQAPGVIISVKFIAPIAINTGTPDRSACSVYGALRRAGANKHKDRNLRSS
jgi:hypothetical protein